MKKSKKEAIDLVENTQRLIILIAGFLLLIYGFLALTDPVNYPLLTLPEHTRLLALVFMALGLFLVLRRREHEH